MSAVIASVTLGMVMLVVTLLVQQPPRRNWHSSMLVLFFVSTGALMTPSALSLVAPEYSGIALVGCLPTALLIGPSLWWSVRGRECGGARHLLFPLAGLGVAALFFVLPPQDRETLIQYGELPDSLLAHGLALAAFVLVLGWIPQSGWYLCRIRHEIASQQSSTTGGREGWKRTKAMFTLCVGLWLSAALFIIFDNIFGIELFGSALRALLTLTGVWWVALWALAPIPEDVSSSTVGFAESQRPPEVEHPKYRRSSLNRAHAEQIVNKARRVMLEQQLYLDPDLSLQRLADAIGAPRNHISQALNSLLGESFFDFVNSYRIEAAKPRVVSGQHTVLEIALSVGFNARSSFYKAFKQNTGLTPTEYRKQGSVTANLKS